MKRGSGLFGFWLRFGSVTGRCGHAPSPKPRQNPKILAPNGHGISLTTLMVGMFAAIAANAAPVVFQSSERQTSLLELYTSEGCSSCPPAEAWLSNLKDSPGLWSDFVPVAFHI